MTTPIPDPDHDPLPVGSQEHYQRFLPIAARIPDDQVESPSVSVLLATVNARTGTEAVLERAPEIRKALPEVSIAAIESLPLLGLALLFAQGQLDRCVPRPADTRELISRVAHLRALLLGSAENLALAGVLPAPVVKKIREGRGTIDAAGDCVALAALFQKHADDVRNKVPFTVAEVAEAAEAGSRLLLVLRPEDAARKPTPAEIVAAAAARNRLWTLLERTWQREVWRSGAWLFGRDAVDEHVPPLGSRVVPRRATETAAEAPTPDIGVD